jgi:hypothetical protein
MKTYKILFWILFSISILFSGYHFLTVKVLEVKIRFNEWTISDLNNDIHIISDLTLLNKVQKNKVDSVLKYNIISDHFKQSGDTIFLHQSILLFKEDTLHQIEEKLYITPK